MGNRDVVTEQASPAIRCDQSSFAGDVRMDEVCDNYGVASRYTP